MDVIYDWMTSSWINGLVVDYPWTWPTLETLHFLGLCLLLGALLIMDLRLIGFQRTIPLGAVHALTPVAVTGFAINLVTGLGFVFGDPETYTANYAFWVKMGLVLLAGLNYAVFALRVEPSLARLGPRDAMPLSAKAVGVASLALWFGVLAYGRLLPYVGG
jgi:hypothetical protein